ncbi:MAG: GNAT family N-acetyltransferase, partial [Chloroflexi bacterium]|nr:GNAT family N-acetyltransferase [Chloroflexota bacterium]
VYIAPEARGKGAAKALMLDLIQAARRWPEVEELRLAVVVENESARKLYRTLGFRGFGIEPRAMKIGDKYVDEEHMALLLERHD